MVFKLVYDPHVCNGILEVNESNILSQTFWLVSSAEHVYVLAAKSSVLTVQGESVTFGLWFSSDVKCACTPAGRTGELW